MLEADPSNVKALFRRGQVPPTRIGLTVHFSHKNSQAHVGNTNFELARADFDSLVKLSGVSKEVVASVEAELKKLKLKGTSLGAP